MGWLLYPRVRRLGSGLMRRCFGGSPPPAAMPDQPPLRTTPLDPDTIGQALAPRPAPPDALPALTDADLILREALWMQMRQMGMDPCQGLDLRQRELAEYEQMDAARYATIARGMSYLRLIEFLSRPPQNFAQQDRQATLGLAYLKYIETDGRDLLAKRGGGLPEEQLERISVELRQKLTWLASATAKPVEVVAASDG